VVERTQANNAGERWFHVDEPLVDSDDWNEHLIIIGTVALLVAVVLVMVYVFAVVVSRKD
jgi:hypothetical protein